MKKNFLPVALVFAAIAAACTPPTGDEIEMKRVPFDPDLYGWKTASWSPFTINDSISGFAFQKSGNTGRCVAVSSSGVIAWSDGGDIWYKAKKDPALPEDAPDPFAVSFNAVAWGGGRFLAAGNGGKTAWSPDGVFWTAEGRSGGIAGFGSENIMGLAFGNGIFVAVGGNANIAYWREGAGWTGCRDPDFGNSQLNDIAFDGGGRFYIAGNDGKRGWSDNPALGNWHYLGPEAPCNTNHIRKVAVGRRGGNTAIGISFNEWGGKRMAIATNSNFGDFDADLDSGLFGNNTINGIAWANGYWVAAGSGAMIGFWPDAEPSNNGQRYWRALSFREFYWWEITALAAGSDRFFVGGIGGKIGYSK